MALAWAPRNWLREDYRGGVFVALHGSLFHAPLDPRGYSVMFAKLAESDSPPRVFAVGRSPFSGGLLGGAFAMTVRPSGLTITPEGSMLIGDDLNQRVWMIRWGIPNHPRR